MLLLGPGCAYKITSRGVEGALAELGPGGRTGGVDALADHILEREIVQQLGFQMGAGLKEGAADISPEQQAEFEQLIDALITTAAVKTGKGLRNEVSPELRAMVRRDITQAFADGLRGEMTESAEVAVRRIVRTFSRSLKKTLKDPEMQLALAEMLRESIYIAMREQQGATPGVGETLRFTLQEDMLGPMEASADNVAGTFEGLVLTANRRTENTLRGVIGSLTIILAILAILYWARGRQLHRHQATAEEERKARKAVDAALSNLLDTDTRRAIQGKAEEYRAVAGEKDPAADSRRSDQYARRR